MDIIALSLDNLFSCYADDKEGEKDLAAVDFPTTQADVDAQRVEANEAEVVDDAITTYEAETEIVDDTVKADAKSHDEDLPITPVANAGDEEDEGEDDDDDDDSPYLPDARKDLGGDDDEDDIDDDFTIQYHNPATPATEEVDVVRAEVEARDNDLPITSAANVGNEEEEDDDEKANLPTSLTPAATWMTTTIMMTMKTTSPSKAEREKNLKLAECDKRWSKVSLNKRINPHPITCVSISARTKDSRFLISMLINMDNLEAVTEYPSYLGEYGYNEWLEI
ncbi:protein SQS1-like [Cynara cardunculus var. scolymus]|uniref:protein SQS1-like n=1 Tax=Cynara cardunculus var. scolymus TaxID=59895 RepID=UPI000D629365|nr:protein SQS1-like [Cynara cardunculus var. scolymus]